ncbi:hypothetical protein [Streptomyces sp. BPTC-684]|uniref:hypothetical protein n=1 Tax=Streptomyces sp. BPTC-684 TaxID=3043734 RepID=UPI0024B241BA|nr:hypothetical protein [Streptomyces sp. BPTC-684]WHM37402.1 hypothetical protein QIY60_11135 [Streptomyces sp. BPTC-684]
MGEYWGETIADQKRRWADSLPAISDELRELACLLGDESYKTVKAHKVWPLFEALFRAETGTDPDHEALNMICNCPVHF